MTTQTLHAPASVYERLHVVAVHEQTTIETIAQRWLVEHAAITSPMSDRERVRAA